MTSLAQINGTISASPVMPSTQIAGHFPGVLTARALPGSVFADWWFSECGPWTTWAAA